MDQTPSSFAQRMSVFHWAGLLFLLNLVLCLFFIFLLFPRLSDATSGLDPDGYGQAGRDLFETGSLPIFTKAPLYPAFIALVSCIAGGYNLQAIQTAQAILSGMTCVLLYLIFRLTLDKESQARLAGLLCAIYPMSIWYVPRLWTEVFLTFTLSCFTLALVVLLKKPRLWQALMCGLAAGFAALSKGIALAFFPLTLFILLLSLRRRSFSPGAVFLLFATLLIAPWTWRNWQITHTLLPIHSEGGLNFFLGNGFARHWRQAPFSYAQLKFLTVQDIESLYSTLGARPAGPIQEDHILLSAALIQMRADPWLLLRKTLIQSLTFWYLAADLPKSLLTGVLQIPVVLLALVGVRRAICLRSSALKLLIPIAGIFGVSVLIFAFARLSATIMPYVIGLAVYGCWPLAMKRSPRWESNPQPRP